MRARKVAIVGANGVKGIAARLQQAIEAGTLTAEKVVEAMGQQQEQIRQLEHESGRSRKDRRRMGHVDGYKSPAEMLKDRARLKRMLGK